MLSPPMFGDFEAWLTAQTSSRTERAFGMTVPAQMRRHIQRLYPPPDPKSPRARRPVPNFVFPYVYPSCEQVRAWLNCDPTGLRPVTFQQFCTWLGTFPANDLQGRAIGTMCPPEWEGIARLKTSTDHLYLATYLFDLCPMWCAAKTAWLRSIHWDCFNYQASRLQGTYYYRSARYPYDAHLSYELLGAALRLHEAIGGNGPLTSFKWEREAGYQVQALVNRGNALAAEGKYPFDATYAAEVTQYAALYGLRPAD